MKLLLDPRWGLLRAARRVVLVVSAGALGAVVCSTGVWLLAPASVENTAAGRGGSSVPASPMVGVGTQRPLGAGERRALELLRRAGLAESTVDYQGMKAFDSWSIWGHVTTMAVVRNVPGKGTTVEASAGAAPHSIAVDNLLDLSDATLTLLADTYRLRTVTGGGLLNRPVTRVDVARPSGAVVGRFWLDDASGLALRRDLLSSAGDVVRRTTFTSVKIQATAVSPMISVDPSPTASAADDCGNGLAAADLDRLRTDGWDLPVRLPGGLTQVCAREVGSGVEKSVQLSYSDGLFALSLFVQRGRLAAAPAGFSRHEISGTTVYLRCGLYRELTWTGHDMVYTVVTDLPDATVAEVIAAVPTTRADAGVLDRMSRGIRRVGSWVDPFN